MKKLTIMIFLLMFTANLFSQSYSMKILLNDGSKITYMISDINKITFDSLLTGTDLNKIQRVIRTFTLSQNYPNPFNPTTTIKYNLPQSGNVEIKIYNIAGRLVKTFQKSHQNSGLHEVIWDGKNDYGNKVASGFYIYQAIFGQNIVSKKMLIIK